MLYALAGVDCIDVAADVAVVIAARQGLADAARLAPALDHNWPGAPWLMVSLNDSDDPHFRKAHFEAAQCPPSCDRPCEKICPTAAIQFQAPGSGGVVPQLCYGCGRCLPVCPVGHILAQTHQTKPEDLAPALLNQIDAVEIHTHAGSLAAFAQLWQRLQPWLAQLKLISISCPDDDQVVDYLWRVYEVMAPLNIPLIWQTDGRPMSGDLGRGTTHATIRLAEKILAANLPGYVQLAGGTNDYTVPKLMEQGLTSASGCSIDLNQGQAQPQTNNRAAISGIAYGSYARTLVRPALGAMEKDLQDWLSQPPPITQLGVNQGAVEFDQVVLTHPGSVTRPSFIAGADSAFMTGLEQAKGLVRPLKHGFYQ